MTFDNALKLLVIAYAVVGITVVVAGSLFMVRLFVRIRRRMK